MAYFWATLAAFMILSFGTGIVVWYFALQRLLDLEARVIWIRSEVDELGRLMTEGRSARDGQSKNTETVCPPDAPGSACMSTAA